MGLPLSHEKPREADWLPHGALDLSGQELGLTGDAGDIGQRVASRPPINHDGAAATVTQPFDRISEQPNGGVCRLGVVDPLLAQDSGKAFTSACRARLQARGHQVEQLAIVKQRSDDGGLAASHWRVVVRIYLYERHSEAFSR
jgi:hypothetical protein